MEGQGLESPLPRKKADRGSTSQSPLDEAPRQVPITVLLGPADLLLLKLDSLKAPGQNLPSDLFSEDQAILLRDLCIRLKDMSEDGDTSIMVQWWMKMVRELCYDTVDHLEEVIHSAPTNQDLPVLLAYAKDASESLEFCKWSPPKATKPADHGGAGVSQLTSFRVRSKAALVVPSNKLSELMDLEGEDKGRTLRVVPLYGCAGVGKTTVARKLYHKHGSKFQCQAFVTASQHPFTRGFLTSMLSQLKAPRPPGCPDVPDLLDAINKHLQGKRYFIVIDDLWTGSLWNVISRAFPRGASCSRIIATTQIHNVALACCGYDPFYIYKMEPLDDYKSLELFFRIKVLNTGLEPKLKSKEYSVQMKYVLDHIYSNLPARLRTCLLYLSMYAQGYLMKKDELVKLWVAEGFLSGVGMQGPEYIAEEYFDELVSRGMIQLVDTNDNSNVVLCSVHQIVLEFIRHKSREENFVITVDYNQSTLALPEKVRRLSVQFGGVKSAHIPESIVTSHVRSLIFWGFFKCIPSSFKHYRLLRVLILHIWSDEDNESVDLSGIGELFLLKYLKIECNITVKLPSKTEGKTDGLPSLTTLDLYIQTAPADGIVIGKDGFKALTHFKFMCAAPCLSFAAEAMPQVQKLVIGFNSNKMKPGSFRTVGFPNLPGLSEVSVQLGDAKKDDIKAAESALESAVWNPLNTPTFVVQRSDVIYFAEEDKSTETEEKEEQHQDVQEGKKKIMEHSEEHVNKQDERRYVRTGLVSMKHHAPSVDVVTGALGSVLPKLMELLKDEYDLEVQIKANVKSLYKELEALQDPLREVAQLEQDRLQEMAQLEQDRLQEVAQLVQDPLLDVAQLDEDRLHEIAQLEQALHEASQRDEVLNAWAREVWDLSYDAEDIVDTLSVRVEGSDPHTELEYGIESLIQRSSALLSREKDRHEIANAIGDSNVFMGEVIQMLGHQTGGVSEEPEALKIVSIVGIGGLGKTTLARAVYDKIKAEYECTVFVPNYRNLYMSNIYKLIRTQIDKQEYEGSCWSKTNTELINEVSRLLAEKRYLIVIDDVWDIESWKRIESALIDSKRGSKIVITTRFMKVAKEVGAVYHLKGLSYQDSEALLHKRLLCGKEEVPSDLPKSPLKLLSKCDGVPLAIITMASLLVGKPTEDWSKLYHSIAGFGSVVRGNTDLKLYCGLSSRLRACLLHLHIFPEGRLINKETLIWKWAAEGLIAKEQKTEKGLFEIGEGYLKELIEKKLLMQVEDDSHPWKVVGYRVDKLVFEIIWSLSTQKNFVTVTDCSWQYSHVESKARRLAVQEWTAEQVDPLANIRPERLRSVNTMGCPFSMELSLSRFQLLRVLALEECSLVEGNLSHLGKLLLLRYLGLRDTPIEKLPEEIGDLIYLQTLDLRGTRVKELPRGVAWLRQLKCLRADQDTAVPDWTGDITSLEELRLGRVSVSKNFVTELGRLRELRELEILIEDLDKNQNKALVHFIRKLEKIQVLRLMSRSPSSGDETDWTQFVPPPTLRELHLSITFSQLPKWINDSSFPLLSHLHVNLKALEQKDLDVLGELPELISLVMLLPVKIYLQITKDKFVKLRYLHASAAFRFAAGAMKSVNYLHIKIQRIAIARGIASSLRCLESIQKVEVELSPSSDDVDEMQKVLKDAADEHRLHPRFSIVRNS